VELEHASIVVEVAYASPDEQVLIRVEVPRGATLREAIAASGVLQRFPEINLESAAVGVFGRLRKLDDVLQPQDRVEIYRPLAIDPKDARRKRAQGKRQPG
jgi:uncharacterized protein